MSFYDYIIFPPELILNCDQVYLTMDAGYKLLSEVSKINNSKGFKGLIMQQKFFIYPQNDCLDLLLVLVL